MRVNHRRAHVLMAEQFLDGPDVVALLQEMGREGVPEGMKSGEAKEVLRQRSRAPFALQIRIISF